MRKCRLCGKELTRKDSPVRYEHPKDGCPVMKKVREGKITEEEFKALLLKLPMARNRKGGKDGADRQCQGENTGKASH